MKKTLMTAAAAVLLACSTTTVGIAVASLGIAGVALEAYCTAGGSGCSPALLGYGELIVAEAAKDATVLESGQATAAQLATIVSNLQAYLTGASIPGLTAQQQQEVSAITAAIGVLIPLVQSILPQHAPSALMVKLPPLTSEDRSALAGMRGKMVAVPPSVR